ncbi:HAD family hydrolase [Tessaracoccus caeni]|uniref:HAD family hydrolase n=1 Tax=Tessaracoccus caeni TaxID=3031239 RepID=UPI0023D9D3F2|nr:HAD-IA family hydrolase [Tessaracoccus caeni]MDF1488327.1 HAD-IA family hydrolase [Tessaracoccus caeni]
MAYRGILLDFYGTVVEEDDLVIRGIAQKIASVCPDWPQREIAQLWGSEFTSAVSSSHGDAFRTQRELAVASLASVLDRTACRLDPLELCAEQFTHWQRPALRPGAREFLASCTLPICVVSNIDRADLDAGMRHIGIALPMTITSEEARSYKPRAEMFEMGLSRLELEPHQVLHIGDSLSSDIAGANALNIDAAWVSGDNRAASDGARIVTQCTDLRDLHPFIQGDITQQHVDAVVNATDNTT